MWYNYINFVKNVKIACISAIASEKSSIYNMLVITEKSIFFVMNTVKRPKGRGTKLQGLKPKNPAMSVLLLEKLAAGGMPASCKLNSMLFGMDACMFINMA